MLRFQFPILFSPQPSGNRNHAPHEVKVGVFVLIVDFKFNLHAHASEARLSQEPINISESDGNPLEKVIFFTAQSLADVGALWI